MAKAGSVPPECPWHSVAQRDPPSVGSVSPTSTRVDPAEMATPGGRRSRASMTPRTATTGVGSMSAPPLSL